MKLRSLFAPPLAVRFAAMVALCIAAVSLAGTGIGVPKLANAPATRAATKPSSRPAPAKWEKAIKAFETADLKSPPPRGAVLFVGSSTIRRWVTLQKDFPELTVLNRGFGGCWMYDVAYYADRIVTPYKPKVIVVYPGGNDIAAGRTPEQVCGDFKIFVKNVRAKMPEVRIVCMGIGPSPKRWAIAGKIQRTNQLIQAYIATTKNIEYVEIWDQMLGPDGKPREDLYVADHQHNNAAGYKIRVDMLRPHLD